MFVKTVTTVVTTDSTGKPVDAIPVRNAVAGETDAAGRPVTPISVTEDPLGIPVRVVTGKSAQNSAGQWIDSIPIQGGGGQPPAVAMPLHARMVAHGNGNVNGTRCKGISNFAQMLVYLSNGAIRMAVGGDQGTSGTSTAQERTRGTPFVIAQQPDLIVIQTGTNDNIVDSGDNSQVAGMFADDRAGCPNAVIVLTATQQRAVQPGGGAQAAALYAAQQALVTADVAAGKRSVFVPIPADLNVTAGVDTDDGIHNNATAAYKWARDIKAALIAAGYMQNVTADSILDDTAANATAGYAANIDTDYSQAGTAGTLSGTVAPTGTAVTGRTVNNALTNGSGVAVAAAASGVAPQEQSITIGGTPAAEAAVSFNDANMTLTGALPGQYYEMLQGYRLDNGGSGPASGIAGFGLSTGASGTALGPFGADAQANYSPVVALDGVLRTRPLPVLLANQPTVAASVQVRGKAGVAVTARERIRKWIVRRIETVAYAAPAYLGNDGVKLLTGNTGEALRLYSGTVANGNVLTFTPGSFSGGGIGHLVKIYSGGGSGGANGGGTANLNTGSLLATLSADTWTWTAAGLVSGTPIYIEATATNSLGSVTIRSEAVTVP
ncbi:SGNH/GDSL hydrolase family protein [Rhizobium binxianense]|uniref:SGNH/GDSL hydrolase family protein n=1 Tax=Rhizobium binxianense TaxID=3024242 RepID=UPI0023A9EA43|nr:SGNH/GDSL hydrolase family protein [Rhizobium sp. MJ22]WEA24036.1 SGNH/GDSL hydrolase family protein [Rhizobium sp. MJ22]